jgi:hypothetical protein
MYVTRISRYIKRSGLSAISCNRGRSWKYYPWIRGHYCITERQKDIKGSNHSLIRGTAHICLEGLSETAKPSFGQWVPCLALNLVQSPLHAGVPAIWSWPAWYTDFILNNDMRFQNACHISMNEAVHDIYPSPNIGRVIQYRRMRWPGLLALNGENRGAFTVLVGKPEGKWHLGVMWVDRRIILKWIYKKWYGRPGFYLSGSGQVKMARFCEHGYGSSGFIKCKLLLDQLRNSAPWFEVSCLPCNMATERYIFKSGMSYLTF